MRALFLGFGLGAAKVIAVKLYKEGGVGLQRAVEALGLAVDLFSIDADALGEHVTGIGMIGLKLNVAANAARNVDRPTVWTGGNFLPGLEQNLLACGFAKILEIETQS